MNLHKLVRALAVTGALLSCALPLLGHRGAATRGDALDLEGEGPWVVRAWFLDRSQVDAAARQLAIWEVRHDLGYLVVDVDRAGLRFLRDLGFFLEVDPGLTVELLAPREPLPGQVFGIPGYPCYRTVEETFASAEAMVAARPDLATWFSIGESWERMTFGGLAGWDLMVLRLTNQAVPGPKPKLFAIGAIHAREYTTAELLTRFAEALFYGHGVDPEATWILDHHEIHLLLQGNPDGRKRAETGLLWRKNANNNYCADTNTRGADLNRNFSFLWGCCGGSSPFQCNQTYRGASPASEPETQAVQAYVLSEFPDQRGPDPSDPAPEDAEGIFLDIHSYSQLVLWPWGYTPQPAPNGQALTTLGRKLAWFNGYAPAQAPELYITDGTTIDFAYGELGLAAYVYELGTAFFQSCSVFESTILPDNMASLFYAAKAARRPYLEPSGPEALEVSLTPQALLAGQPVSLDAVIDGSRFNQSNGIEPIYAISGARFTIDTPPWEDTLGTPLDPVDGSFDSPVEAASGTIDTCDLEEGRYLVYVVGENTLGRSGVPTGAFFDIVGPATHGIVEGRVMDLHTGEGLSATVSAGTASTETDPSTGNYSLEVPIGTWTLTAQAEGYLPESVEGLEITGCGVLEADLELLPEAAVWLFADGFESGDLSAWH
jgi:carboxypeptidase T